jgi:HK97 family phage major capsid protein
MKEKLLKLLKSKEERKAALKKTVDSTDKIGEIRSAQTEIDGLNSEITEINGMIAEIEAEEARNANPQIDPNIAAMPPKEGEGKPAEGRGKSPIGKSQILGTFGLNGGSEPSNQRSEAEALKAKFEQRGQDLKDRKKVTYDVRSELPISRAITVASSNLVVPNQTSNTLNPTFNQVSSLVDLVHAVPMMGGETYTKGFKVPVTELPDYTPENTAYKNVDSVWDKVTISKTYLTDYTEISKQSIKLPNIDYQGEVGTDLRNALRRKIAREILIGDGEAGHFVGIFNAPENVIPAASDLEITEIDADTLDSIVFGYGGDEDVEGTAYLILSKKDLSAFAAIRTADGKKLYKIVTNGNTGTISSDDSFSVNYVLNSACPALSVDATASGTYCMAYGVLQNYEMPVFSDIDVEMSTDYKFGEGMVAYAGDIYSGGNVAAYKGFERIKKA